MFIPVGVVFLCFLSFPLLAASQSGTVLAINEAVPAHTQYSVTPSFYDTGQEQHLLKAMSNEERDALLTGRCMGLTKVAELNSYPGPAHVLDMADVLNLTDGQKAALTRVSQGLAAEAVGLGHQIVEREQVLDRLFAAEGRIQDPAMIASLAAEIGTLRGRLRAVHLVAHLETRAILLPEQAQKYIALRGYRVDASIIKKHLITKRSIALLVGNLQYQILQWKEG